MSSNIIVSLKPENVIRHIPWQLNSRSALGLVLLLALVSLVGWLYVTQASAVTTTSYRIDEFRMELDHIKNQNAALIMEIAELEALSRVEKRALALGFQPVKEVRYISVDNYPAALQRDGGTLPAAAVENSVDAYVADVEQPNWWLTQLDTVAEWVAGR